MSCCSAIACIAANITPTGQIIQEIAQLNVIKLYAKYMAVLLTNILLLQFAMFCLICFLMNIHLAAKALCIAAFTALFTDKIIG